MQQSTGNRKPPRLMQKYLQSHTIGSCIQRLNKMTQAKKASKCRQLASARSSPPAPPELILPPEQIKCPSLSFTCSVISQTFLISSSFPLVRGAVFRMRLPIWSRSSCHPPQTVQPSSTTSTCNDEH